MPKVKKTKIVYDYLQMFAYFTNYTWKRFLNFVTGMRKDINLFFTWSIREKANFSLKAISKIISIKTAVMSAFLPSLSVTFVCSQKPLTALRNRCKLKKGCFPQVASCSKLSVSSGKIERKQIGRMLVI